MDKPDEPRGPPYTPDEELPDPKAIEIASLRLCVDCKNSLNKSIEEPCRTCLAARDKANPNLWTRPEFVPSEDLSDVVVD